jgi:hypothetical protein
MGFAMGFAIGFVMGFDMGLGTGFDMGLGTGFDMGFGMGLGMDFGMDLGMGFGMVARIAGFLILVFLAEFAFLHKFFGYGIVSSKLTTGIYHI